MFRSAAPRSSCDAPRRRVVGLGGEGAKWLGALAAALCVVPAGAAEEGDSATVPTENGAPLKVIVRQDTSVRERPDDAARSKPARMFSIYYVLRDPAAAGDGPVGRRDGFYRVGVGKNESDFQGWIPEADVVEWSHREVLIFRDPAGRRTAEFYPDRDTLAAAYDGADVPPLAEEPEGGAAAKVLPVLEVFDADFAGDAVKGYEVAYLQGGGGSGGGAEAVAVKDLTLEVAFVVDTTASMQPHIDAVRRAVRELADELRSDLPVRFALVGYRDAVAAPPGDWYLAKVLCKFNQGEGAEAFDRAVAGVAAADAGSEDFPEDVFAGVKTAVTDLDWSPTSLRHVVLVGDASAQTALTGPKNPQRLTVETVIKAAQPTSEAAVGRAVTIHAVRIVGDDPADHAAAEEHFELLAQGDGSAGGRYASFSPGDLGGFVGEVRGTIVDAYELIDEVQKGGAVDPTAPGAAQMVARLRAADAVGGAAPSFGRGYCYDVDPELNSLFQEAVLVRRTELESFNGALGAVTALFGRFTSGGGSPEQLIAALQFTVTQLAVGEQIEVGDSTDVAELLGLMFELPIKTEIYSMSAARWRGMSEADRQAWLENVQVVNGRLTAYLDNRKVWFPLGDGTAAGRPEDLHFFIPVTDLP